MKKVLVLGASGNIAPYVTPGLGKGLRFVPVGHCAASRRKTDYHC